MSHTNVGMYQVRALATGLDFLKVNEALRAASAGDYYTALQLMARNNATQEAAFQKDVIKLIAGKKLFGSVDILKTKKLTLSLFGN